MGKSRNQTAMIAIERKEGRAIMAVISRSKINKYVDSNLFDLIHNYMPKPKEEHLVVTRYNSSEEKKKHIEKEKTLQNFNNSNNHSKQISNGRSSTRHYKKNNPKIEKVNMSSKVGEINLDTNLDSEKLSKKTKPHPTLEVITGEPTPIQQRDINKKTDSEVSVPNKTLRLQHTVQNAVQMKLKEEKTEQMPDIKDTIMHHKPVEKKLEENKNEDVYNKIQKAANAATFIEKTQVHVKLRAAIDKLPIKEINVIDLTNGSESYIPLDSMFFHLLGFATIGENLDVVLMFRDGTQMQIASPKMLSADDSEKVKQYLIKNNYTFVYKDTDIKKLADCFKQLSSFVFNNNQLTQYYIEFLPVISK